MRSRHSAILLTCAAFACLDAFAQTDAQSQPPEKHLIRRGPVEHGEAQGPMLTFDIVAFDAKGAAYRDLRPVDLDIRDEGKAMHAVFCRPLETAERLSPPLGPNEFTNRLSGGAAQSTLILLDLLNANFDERGMAWNDIVNTLQKAESGQNVYFYLLTKEATLYPVHALPSAERPRPANDEAWVSEAKVRLDEAMHVTNRLRPWEYQADVDARVRKTLAVLRDLAGNFGSQPGRKSLVWISHGVPMFAKAPDGLLHDYTPPITRLGTEFARSGIAVYAVDQTDRATQGMASMDTLEELAALTSGQWLPNNETDRALEAAMSEGPATYQVGYRPPMARWDGKFHKVRVTGQGKGGVKLRIRAIDGYYGDTAEGNTSDRFTLAAVGHSDDSGIGLRATAAPSERVRGWVHLQIRVDASDLHLGPSEHLGSAEPYTGSFRVAFAQYTDDWQSGISEMAPVELHLTTQQRDAILHDGVVLSLDRPVPEGASRIRVIVQDNQSDAVGSLTIPVGTSPKP
jgi:VWFA-related protein